MVGRTSLDTRPVNEDPGVEASLVDDKLARVLALHARWNYEDTEEQGLEGQAFQARRQTRCKELGSMVQESPKFYKDFIVVLVWEGLQQGFLQAFF